MFVCGDLSLLPPVVVSGVAAVQRAVYELTGPPGPPS